VLPTSRTFRADEATLDQMATLLKELTIEVADS
jgi:hypothetical protein